MRVLVPALGMPFSGCTRRQQARHVRCVHGGVAYASLFNRSDALLLTKRQDFGRSGDGFCACSARSLDFSCTPPQRGTRHGQAPATGQNRPQDRLRGTRRYFVQASSILPQCVEIVCRDCISGVTGPGGPAGCACACAEGSRCSGPAISLEQGIHRAGTKNRTRELVRLSQCTIAVRLAFARCSDCVVHVKRAGPAPPPG